MTSTGDDVGMAEVVRILSRMEERLKSVEERLKNVEERLKNVEDDLKRVGERTADVDSRVSEMIASEQFLVKKDVMLTP